MAAIADFFKEHKKYLIVLLLTWGIFFTLIFSRIVKMEPEGLYFGHGNVWSDWALHTATVNIFAYKDVGDWFAYHPIYAGGKFTYPFLVNLISGLLVRVGFSLPVAFIIPSLILSFALILGLYVLFFKILNSKGKSLLALSIFFLSSGPGFIQFLGEFLNQSSFSFWAYPPEDYTRILDYDWLTGNVIVGLLIPQRAFLLGMVLGVWSLIGLISGIQNVKEEKYKKLFLFGGLGAGLLPIAHAHSFMAVVVIAALICWYSRKNWKKLLWYVVPAGILSGVLYLKFVSGGIENESFISWLVGWTAKGGIVGWAKMWLKIWGLTLPVAIWGWSLYKGEKVSKTFILGTVTIFLLANLIVFQPIRWDNTKLFWWAYLGFSGLCSVALSYTWQKKDFFAKISAIVLFLVLTLTGVLELIRLQRVDQHNYMISSREEINLGEKIRSETDALAIFLTAPQHNQFVHMWGVRPILLGYTAWAYNYGFNYYQRENDIKVMYKGDSSTKDLLKQYDVSYVVIGPTEIRELSVNKNYFDSNFPVAFESQNYTIYDVRSLWLQ